MPRGVERSERRHRKGRRSHEGDAHGEGLWRRLRRRAREMAGDCFVAPLLAMTNIAGGLHTHYHHPMASTEIEALVQQLARLPGLGPRSARRAVLHLMKKRESAFAPLLAALQSVSERLVTCTICGNRSEEHTSELQSLMRISYAVLCLKKKNTH